MKTIKRNLIEILMLVAAKILGVLAIGSAFSSFKHWGLPLFAASFLFIIYCVARCIWKMKLATNTYGESWEETVEL